MKISAIIDGRQHDFELGIGRHQLGRSTSCALVIPHNTVSRHHADIEITRTTRRIRDAGSQNGTTLNGREVSDWTELFSTDEIMVGNILLRIIPDAQRTLSQLSDQGFSVQTMIPARQSQSVVSDNKKVQLFSILTRASALLGAVAHPGELADDILNLVDEAFAPTHKLIALIESEDAAETTFEILAQRGPGDVPFSHSIAHLAVETQSAILVADAPSDTELCHQKSIISLDLRTAMAAPLLDGERAFGLLYAHGTTNTKSYTPDDLQAFVSLANVVAMALIQARLRALELEKTRLDDELSHARTIMKKLIPAELPTCPGYEIAAHLEPCFEVGGDLYDAFLLPDGQYVVCLGDVAGKGLGAALMVSSMLPLLRGLIHGSDQLGRDVRQLSELMFQLTEPARFATLFVGVLDPASGRFTYVNAGHNPPLVVSSDGNIRELPATGLPVALVDHAKWAVNHIDLAANDVLAIYSDGIPEAWRDEDTDYGDERLQATLKSLAGGNVMAIRAAVLADLALFLDGVSPSDDVALVLLRRLVLQEDPQSSDPLLARNT